MVTMFSSFFEHLFCPQAPAAIVAMDIPHVANRLPLGLHHSDSESATASRERRRVAMAAREVVGAVSQTIASRLDSLEAKIDEIAKNCAAIARDGTRISIGSAAGDVAILATATVCRQGPC